MNRKLPVPFEIYRHFKGNNYQIICNAKDADTGEDVVVYQALYGDYTCYTRPLSQFLSETDLEKYPDAGQTNRFQKVSVPAGEEKTESRQEKEPLAPALKKAPDRAVLAEPKPGEADPALLAFLDADTMEEKSNILVSIRHRITDRLIDDFAVTLDVVIPEGSVDIRYQQLLNSIRMVQKYEIERPK